ncbi:MAG TPA: DUF3303 family protein [Pyrinomonadaceae bacterium]|jgi:hypothetical protein|nr:DUF3303 family protein [Pyrinomonadaceae bacterium]
MLFIVIEKFKNRDPKPVYERFLEKGRMMPEGLIYRESWIESNFERCFQLMECDDISLLQEWILVWQDLAEFEIVAVAESKKTSELVKKFL